MSRREEIIQAALSLVNESGSQAMSVRNVAAKAGIGASTLRYYFPRYRDLVDAVVAAAVADTLGDKNIHNAQLPAVDRLVECLFQFLPQTPQDMTMLEATLSGFATSFEDGKLIGNPNLAEVADYTRSRVSSWLEVLQSQGYVLPMPPSALARILTTYLNGVAIDLIVEAPEFGLEQAREQLRTMVTLVLSEENKTTPQQL